MLSISQLKSKWNKEEDSYVKQEIGSGVQKFVKDVLKSPEIFNLKEGLISASDEKRKSEFTEESRTKAARKADVIIYINQDIKIPMEVERYGEIEKGFDQLMQYQKDVDKKFGILTDGYYWRFYNNAYLLKTFDINEIFKDPGLFLDFWKEYIKPENYYLSFFKEIGQLKILPEDLSVEKRRQDFFRDITTLIRSFKNKLAIEGYFKDLEEKERKKKAVEITYAYIIQFILYKTLVDNDFGKFKKQFQDFTESINDCLKTKQYAKILGIIDGISNGISQNIYRPFIKEQKFINKTLQDLSRKPKNELHDVSPWLDIFIFIKNYNFVNVKNEIFGYIYENYLKELYEDTKKGQYFTDPAVVNFMLEQIGYTKENIAKRLKNQPEDDSISIIDPSCGSGTFLYSAVDQLINAVPNGSEESSKKIEELLNDNIFGLDIAEFPLYLAEMNILMRMLPIIINEKYNNPINKKIKVFKTQDSISEFMDTEIRNTMHDIAGQQSFFSSKKINLDYASFMREETDLEEMKKSLEKHLNIPRKRFDFVIGNPPYVAYNECSKQGVLVFDLMKQGKIRLNDIFGVNLHSIPSHQKKYSPKPNLYAFFIALGIALLKDDGKLCFIIPQTILTAGDLDVLRYHLANFTIIEKIITFSGNMFVGRGLKQNKAVATSSLIFVVKRRLPGNKLNLIDVVHYKNANDDIEKCLKNMTLGKNIIRKKIPQKNLFQNIANWNFIKQGKLFLDFYEEYKKNTEDISIYYHHATAELKFGNRFYFDIGYNINEKLLQEEMVCGGYQYPKLDDKTFSIKSFKGHWPNERKTGNLQIKLLTTNQGYSLLDSPYKILWSYINTKRFHFSLLPLIWARNQICGIGSQNKTELIYLFSILNTPINNKLLSTLLKSEQEKDLLVSIASLKQFVRVPKITEDNQFIKDEIIKKTEEMLALEDINLSDLVDFSGVLMQKFDSVKVEGGNLILEKDDKEIKCEIQKDADLVKNTIKRIQQDKKLFKEGKVIFSELKNMPAIDFEKQKKIKDYIDDLVFALYFNVPIKKVGIDKAKEIKKECEKSKFYGILDKK